MGVQFGMEINNKEPTDYIWNIFIITITNAEISGSSEKLNFINLWIIKN
jgi:hypothetical protein